MIVLTSDQTKELIEICSELDKALWRCGWPPENEQRTAAVRMQKELTEALRHG